MNTIVMEKTSSVEAGTATNLVKLECVKKDGEWKIKDFNDDMLEELLILSVVIYLMRLSL